MIGCTMAHLARVANVCNANVCLTPKNIMARQSILCSLPLAGFVCFALSASPSFDRSTVRSFIRPFLCSPIFRRTRLSRRFAPSARSPITNVDCHNVSCISRSTKASAARRRPTRPTDRPSRRHFAPVLLMALGKDGGRSRRRS